MDRDVGIRHMRLGETARFEVTARFTSESTVHRIAKDSCEMVQKNVQIRQSDGRIGSKEFGIMGHSSCRAGGWIK
jgi:hypothetical protein